ncbi:hypothetical protein Ancab_015437 [Ancistrocladus abbreviatus]
MAPMQMDKSSCKHDGSQQNQLNGHIGNGGSNHDQDRKPTDAAGGHARGRDMNGAVGCGKRPVCDEPSFYTAGNNFKDSETGTFNQKGKSAEERHKEGSRDEGCNKVCAFKTLFNLNAVSYPLIAFHHRRALTRVNGTRCIVGQIKRAFPYHHIFLKLDTKDLVGSAMEQDQIPSIKTIGKVAPKRVFTV